MRSLIPIIKVNYCFKDVIKSFFISSTTDKYLKRLEKEIKQYFRTENVLLTSSGRDALYQIIRRVPKSKVLVPAYTCDVVVDACLLAGKEVVFSHIDGDNLNMREPYDIDEDTIVIATHQYGNPCDIEHIRDICTFKKALLIEDCAGALGLRINGKLAGSFGDYAFFSMNSSKLITAPAVGGFVLSNKPNGFKDVIFDNNKRSDFVFKVRSLCKSIALCCSANPFLNYYLSCIVNNNKQAQFIPAEQYEPKLPKKSTYGKGFYNWQAYSVHKQFVLIDELVEKRRQLIDEYKRSGVLNLFPKVFSCTPYGNRLAVYVPNRSEFVEACHKKGVAIGTGFSHYICPLSYNQDIEIASHIVYLPLSSSYSSEEVKKIMSSLKEVLL